MLSSDDLIIKLINERGDRGFGVLGFWGLGFRV
jgi:hypothetical protein